MLALFKRFGGQQVTAGSIIVRQRGMTFLAGPGTGLGVAALAEPPRERGYDRIFEAVGAHFIEPSCGACINAGPGVSRKPTDVDGWQG